MKKLTLLRHAKSDWNSAATSDFDRPLNQRGKKAAPLMGTRQTATIIAEQVDYPEERIEFAEEIYDAARLTLINLVKSLSDDFEDVMLIGHNPGFSELGEWLTPEAPDWLPTCGLLELELACASWTEIGENCATLLLYDYPKKPG